MMLHDEPVDNLDLAAYATAAQRCAAEHHQEHVLMIDRVLAISHRACTAL